MLVRPQWLSQSWVDQVPDLDSLVSHLDNQLLATLVRVDRLGKLDGGGGMGVPGRYKPLPLDLSLAPLPLSPQSCSLRKMVKDQVTQVSKPQYCNLGGYCDVGRGGGCTAKAVLF